MRSKRYPATIVKEYAWCPVAAWLAANLGATPPPTPQMLEGKERHREALEAVKRLYPDAHPLPPLHSKRWPLTATPDAYSPSTKTIIEAKHAANPTNRIYRIQAMLYATIAQENHIPVDRAAIIDLTTGKQHIIEIDAATHKIIEQIVKNTLDTIKQPLPPPTTQPPQKCKACRWRRHCPNANT